MGRHSVADDDEADDAAVSTATLVPVGEAPPRGRHARGDDEVEADSTAAAPTVQLTKPAKQRKPPKPAKEPKPPKPAKAPKPAKEPKPPKPAKEPKPAGEKKPSGTRADLRLLRENRLVRACCLGVVVLAFLGYTVVMLALGKSGSYLFWLWIPIVLSGVLVGAVLDLAYRSQGRPPDSTANPPPDPSR